MNLSDDGSFGHTGQTLDDRALVLRRAGRSYAAIARELGLGRARDAHAAFLRALDRLPPDEQAATREEELRRLDRLERSLVEQAGADNGDLARKRLAIARLRDALGR
jgi:hypothetical protein